MPTNHIFLTLGALGAALAVSSLWAIFHFTEPDEMTELNRIALDLSVLKQLETTIDGHLAMIGAIHLQHPRHLHQYLIDFKTLRDSIKSRLRQLDTISDLPLGRETGRSFKALDEKIRLIEKIDAEIHIFMASLARLREDSLTVINRRSDKSPEDLARLFNAFVTQQSLPKSLDEIGDLEAFVNELARLPDDNADHRQTHDRIRQQLALILEKAQTLKTDFEAINKFGTHDHLSHIIGLVLNRLDRSLVPGNGIKALFVTTIGILFLLMLIALFRLYRAHRQAEKDRIRLHDAVAGIPAALSIYDKDDKLVLWNKRFENFLPTLSGRLAAGMTFRSLMVAAVRSGQFELGAKGLRPFIRTLLSRHERTDGGIYHKTSDGRHIFALDSPVSDGGTASVLVDVTETKKIQEQMHKLSLAVEQSPVSVIITDAEGTIEYVNKTFTKVTGWEPEEVLGRNPRLLKSGYTSANEYRELWKVLKEGKEWRGEFHNRRKNGELFWEHSRINPIRNEDGETTHFLAVKEDITEKKHQEALLYRHTRYDQLTNLPNRSMAAENLHTAITLARRTGHRVGVMFIDLDNFKNVNDSLGHGAGDLLLQQSVKRITQCVQEFNVVARLGGDEFCIIMSDIPDREEVAAVAKKLLSAFQDPFEIAGQLCYTTVSIGIAVYPENGTEPHNLMRRADAALFRVKDSGRNNYAFFSEQMKLAMVERRQIEMRLRHAIEHKNLEVHYQPLVSAHDALIVGAEALCRWNDDEMGWVTPDRFIPVAEEHGLISEIGRQVLRTSCIQAKHWVAQDTSFGRISVNVSTRQLQGNAEFVDMVKSTLEETGLDTTKLELEITESLLLDNFSGSRKALADVRDLGVSISIDDFGTGYSSLSYLKKFRFDTLKIDRTFVRDMVDDGEARTLVHSLTSMAQALNLEMIAEGVENTHQLDHLRGFGCKLLQGYLFCKPVPAPEFEMLLLKKEPLL